MSRQLRAPGRYVQGEGVLADAAAHLAPLDADRALLAGGTTALGNAEDDLRAALSEAGVAPAGAVEGVSESTEARISKIGERAEIEDADLLVGVGGGTAIDAAKAAATRRDRAFVSVPTVASTDAPASGVSVVYDEAGRPVDSVERDRSPELVLADTALVADAPARFLRWGTGDALATTFEAEACAASGARTSRGAEPSDAGLVLARRCHEVVETHGADALAAVERGEVTPAVEAVVETALLHSALGFENAGLAAAHSLEIGCRLAGHTDAPHGELVGVCTLAQLVLEDHAGREALAALLASLGFEDVLPPDDLVDDAAEFACMDVTRMDNEPVEVTPEDAAAALREARRLLERAHEAR